jgi:hypothetical protein
VKESSPKKQCAEPTKEISTEQGKTELDCKIVSACSKQLKKVSLLAVILLELDVMPLRRTLICHGLS